VNRQHKQCELCANTITVGAICDECFNRLHPPKPKQFRYWYSEEQRKVLRKLQNEGAGFRETTLVQLPDGAWKHYTEMTRRGAEYASNFPDSVLVAESDTNLPIRTP